MKRSNYYLSGVLLLTVSFTLMMGTFQNCSDVGFDSTDELVKAGVDGELRGISFNPEEKENRPSISVSTILDNSNSMKPIQDEVASSFQSVTSRLRGFSGDMALYTTTQSLTGDKSSVDLADLVRYRGPDGFLEIPLSQIGTLSPSTSYWNVKRYSISKSHTTSGHALPFWSSMTDPEFADFTNEYVSSISSVGVKGDDKEQTLCTLLRAAKANQSSQSFQAFILATNEDDATDSLGCLDEKTQEVQKVLNDPSAVACQPGDVGCTYTYEMSYLPNKEQRLNYSYRKVTETVSYQSKTPVESWKVEYRWNRYRKYFYYQVKQRKEWVSYERYVLVDSLPEAEQVTHIYNYNSGNPYEGYCAAENIAGKAVSCDEVLASIPANLRPYGLVPGSCKLHCQNQLSAQTNKPIADYGGGTCADNGQTEGYRACTAGEPTAAAGLAGIGAANLVNCQHRCVTDGNTLRSENLPSKPANCNTSCNASQREFADSKSPSYISPGNIYECNVKCSESFPTNTFTLTDRTIYQCSGLGADQNGSVGPTDCMGDATLKQLAANNLGSGNVNDLKTCNYTCSHSIRTTSLPVTSPATCSVGKTACSTDQWNQAVQHFLSNSGTSELFMLPSKCENECVQLPALAKCAGKRFDNGNMCLPANLSHLSAACAATGHQLDTSSCKHDGGYRLQPSTQYKAVAGNWQSASMIGSSNDPVQTVAEKLHSSFADRFFVASFIVPPGDPNCVPESVYIPPGHSYTRLHTLLGDGNSKLFPVCLDSYDTALTFVLDLITRWISRSYQLNIDPETEWVWRVRLIYGNGEAHEVLKSLYQVEKGVLKFSEDVSLEGVVRVDVQVVTPRRK